jgi:two-component system response regulator FlrC
MLHNWPGNVRELENIIHRAVVVCDTDTITAKHLFLEKNIASSRDTVEIKAGISMRDTEKQLILKTLKATMNNRTQAAKLLGISIRTLRNKLREYREKDGLIID